MTKLGEMSHYNNGNVLSMHALIGAYKPEGREWVDELCQVIGENVNFACGFIENILTVYLWQSLRVLICFI